MRIRTASSKDWDRIVEIYNQAIETGYSTADLEAVTVASRKAWLEEHLSESYPIYVAENGQAVLGWCSLSPYRKGRMALRHTAEISYYVANDSWRQGVASGLITHALDEAPRLGLKTLFGILFETNEGSIRLLEKFGFEKWGHLPLVADFHGQECGHVYMGIRLEGC